MLKPLSLLITIVLLSGCSLFSSKEDVVIDDSKVITHPQEPQPVIMRSQDWKVYKLDDEIFVGLKYDNFVDYVRGQEDVLRYIRESNAIICFYKRHFDEESVLCIDNNRDDQ